MVYPRYTTIHKVTFEQCTLGFPGLASLMQALPHLEGLKIADEERPLSQRLQTLLRRSHP